MRHILHALSRYLLTALATVAVFVMMLYLPQPLRNDVLFMPALVAVMVAGLVGGVGPALLNVVLAVCALGYWFLAPAGSAALLRTEDWGYLAAYAALALMVAALSAQYRRSHLAARLMAARLQALLDCMPVGLAFLDPEGRYVSINRELARINGRSIDEHIGRAMEDMVPAQVAEPRRHMHEQVLQTGEAIHGLPFSMPVPGLPGGMRHWLRSHFPVRLDGAVIGTAAALMEVTPLRHAEEALRRQADELQVLCETLTVMIWRLTPDGATTYLNAAARTYFGLTDDPHGRSDWMGRIHPEDVETVNTCWVEAVGRRASYVLEARLQRARDGQYRWHLLQAAPLRDDQGTVLAWLGTSTDIHDQKNAITERDTLIRQLRAAEERQRQTAADFRLLSDMVPQIIWTTETLQTASYMNQRGLAFFGLSAGELEADDWTAHVHPDDVTTVAGHWQAVARDQAPYQVEVRLRRHDGVYRWHQIRGLPVRDGQGRIARWIGSCIDIDDQKHAIEIREAYLSTVSQELKTPITALLLQLYVLNRRWAAVDPELARRVAAATGHAEHLTQLANNLLNVSRIISGQFDDPHPVSLHEVVDEVVERFGPDLGLAGLSVANEAPGPVVGVWDRLHVEQILTNLMTNALKYGQGRPVHIRVGIDGDVACLDVTDRGLNVDTSDPAGMITRFSPQDGTAGLPGHGQGLWLVRHLAERMGGHVSVFRLPGEGATFSVRLPLAPGGRN